MSHYVYRCYGSDGRLLYVGISKDFVARLEQHRSRSFWAPEVAKVRVLVYPNRLAAFAVEKAAIETERPRFNYQGKWRTRAWWAREDYRDYVRTLMEGRRGAGVREVFRLYAETFGEVYPGAPRILAQLDAEAQARAVAAETNRREREAQSRRLDALDQVDMYRHFVDCPPCAAEGRYSLQCPSMDDFYEVSS